MQLMYILALFMLLMSLVFSSYPREPDPQPLESQYVLLNMATWHTAAVKRCVATPCASGLINPVSYLPEMIRENDNITNQFQTRYDATTKDIVTYVRPAVMARFNGPNAGTLQAALEDALGKQTGSVGIYQRSGRKLIPNYPIRDGYEKIIPASIAGNIDDGTPIIATKM